MPDRMFTAEEVEEIRRQERRDQQVHDVKGQVQGQSAAQNIAASVAAALAPVLASLKPPPPLPEKADVPPWLKITGALGALFLTGAGVVGIVWSMAIRPVETRLDSLEKVDVAYLATTSGLATRLSAAENKIAQIETTISTAGRIRDQQAQGMGDQVRSLLQSDQEAAKRLEQQSNIIASILPRLEEILRRQERLENRLGAQRVQPNSDEMPMALWTIPPAI